MQSVTREVTFDKLAERRLYSYNNLEESYKVTFEVNITNFPWKYQTYEVEEKECSMGLGEWS